MKSVIYIQGKRYYFYKIFWNVHAMLSERKRYPNTRYYWEKIYNKRNGKTGYILYLSRRIV